MRWSMPWFLLCGALAGWWIGGVTQAGLVEQLASPPPDGLETQLWRLERPVEDPKEVLVDRWFFEPRLFGDFDLQMDVELAEGAELDVLLRQVEPRPLGSETLPFAARWSALRLSTDGDGVGWRTRDEALFGPRGGGVGVAPGYVSTVWIEARGRTLTANVAGKKQPPFVADDRYGMLTLITRGGSAVLRRLEIRSRPAALWWWSPWTWTGLGALANLLVLVVTARMRRVKTLWTPGVLVVAIAWLLAALYDGAPLALPDLAAMACLQGAVACGAFYFVRARGTWTDGLPLVPLLLLAFVGLRHGGHDTAAVDAAFGAGAGSQVTEAHGQLVRGPFGLHDVTCDGPRVFLLGGTVLYGLVQPEVHMQVLLAGELQRRVKRRVDVPCPQTEFADVGQQWRMFRRFYSGFEPDVVVLGVDVVADGDSLPDVVEAARAGCAERGARLVLFATDALAEEHLTALRRFDAGGVPLVVGRDGEPRSAIAARLADAIVPGLPR